MLVTGGGRGIGRAVSLLCAAARLGRRRELRATMPAAADEVVAAIEAEGGRAVAIRADVANDAQVRAMFETIDSRPAAARRPGEQRRRGRPAVAGRRDDAGAPRAHVRDQRLRQLLLRPRGGAADEHPPGRRGGRPGGNRGGAIVNLSSAAAKLGAPGQYVDYAAAKGAIETFTIGLAKEVAAEGIRVNAVRPGIIETEIHASGGQPDRVAQMLPLLPMQRAGSAEEVAEAIVFLLSDAASYTTGSILEVTGGR